MKMILLLSTALLLSACSKTLSENVKTAGLYTSFHVEMDEHQIVHCYATFQVGGGSGTYLELTGGDDVECNGIPMQKQEFMGAVRYATNVATQADNTYTITFSRPTESPYRSIINIPSDFTVMSPIAESVLNKNQSFEVKWSISTNLSDSMNAQVRAETGSSTHYLSLSDQAPENGILRFDPIASGVTGTPSGTWVSQLEMKRSHQFSQPIGLDGITNGTRLKLYRIYFND